MSEQAQSEQLASEQSPGGPVMAEQPDIDTATSVEEICPQVEALLLMATEPAGTAALAEILAVPEHLVEGACQLLSSFYDESGRGFELRHVGGGWRLWTRPEHGELISRWVLEGQHSKLSQAALETLSVIAYLQPISRSRVSAVRGVNVDGVVRTLLSRGLVEELEPEPGSNAVLFGTTDYFLERMGMESITELPPLAPHLPDAADLEQELARATQLGAPDSPDGDQIDHQDAVEAGPEEPNSPNQPDKVDNGTHEY